jgi:amino acid transporter
MSGFSAFNAQGYFGTLCSFGFIVVYVMISISAPLYLRSIGKLTKKAVIYSVLAVSFMALPFLGTVGIPGSTLFQSPGYPNNVLPYIFIAYMLVGLIWLWVQRARHPKMIARMTMAIDQNDIKFARQHSAS